MKVVFNKETKIFSVSNVGTVYIKGEKEQNLNKLREAFKTNDFAKAAVAISNLKFGEGLTPIQEKEVTKIANKLVDKYINNYPESSKIYVVNQFYHSMKFYATNADKLRDLMK